MVREVIISPADLPLQPYGEVTSSQKGVLNLVREEDRGKAP